MISICIEEHILYIRHMHVDIFPCAMLTKSFFHSPCEQNLQYLHIPTKFNISFIHVCILKYFSSITYKYWAIYFFHIPYKQIYGHLFICLFMYLCVILHMRTHFKSCLKKKKLHSPSPTPVNWLILFQIEKIRAEFSKEYLTSATDKVLQGVLQIANPTTKYQYLTVISMTGWTPIITNINK